MSFKRQYFPPGKYIYLIRVIKAKEKNNLTLGNPNQICYSHLSSLRLYDPAFTQTDLIGYVVIQ